MIDIYDDYEFEFSATIRHCDRENTPPNVCGGSRSGQGYPSLLLWRTIEAIASDLPFEPADLLLSAAMDAYEQEDDDRLDAGIDAAWKQVHSAYVNLYEAHKAADKARAKKRVK